MQEALSNLGVDIKLLIAQLVNFTILLVALYLFLYKPILKMLNERSKKISTSLETAEKIEERLVQVEQEVQQKIVEADKKAVQIIAETKDQAKELQTKLEKEATIKANQIVDKAKSEVNAEKKKMMVEIQQEISGLVAESIKKMAQNNSINLDDKLIDQTVAQIKKEPTNG